MEMPANWFTVTFITIWWHCDDSSENRCFITFICVILLYVALLILQTLICIGNDKYDVMFRFGYKY